MTIKFLAMYWRVQMHLRLSEIAEQYDGLTVVVTPDTKSAVRFITSFTGFNFSARSVFPDWETLPYDSFSPHQEIISSRFKCAISFCKILKRHLCFAD